MLGRLLILFVVLPLVELYLLLRLHEWTNWQTTLGVVIVTGAVGIYLARSQGWRTYRKIQTELAAGRVPTTELLDGLLILVAGAVLLTPGLLTDLFGLSLLTPFCRAWYRRRLVSWAKSRFRVQMFGPGQQSGTSKSGTSQSGTSDTIDSYVVDPSDDEDASKPDES